MNQARGIPPAHSPLAFLTRGELIEGVHFGSVVAADADGATRFKWGDPDAACFPRSTLKPVQTAAMVRAGLDLPPELLALATSSHLGGPQHVVGVRRLLELYGLRELDLRNPEAWPADPDARARWVDAGGKRCRAAHMCSGMHAAMLATARVNGWAVRGYLEPDHPVQATIARTVAELVEEPLARTAADGCGAPLFAMSLTGLARAIGRIAAAAPDVAEGKVIAAMRQHPQMVGGKGHLVTALMGRVPGLIAREGAEAVCVAGLADGTGLAVKIADGARRALAPVVAAALVACGVERKRVAGLLRPSRARDGICLVPSEAFIERMGR